MSDEKPDKTSDEYEYHGDEYTAVDYDSSGAYDMQSKLARKRRILWVVGFVIISVFVYKFVHMFMHHHHAKKAAEKKTAITLKKGHDKIASPFANMTKTKSVVKSKVHPIAGPVADAFSNAQTGSQSLRPMKTHTVVAASNLSKADVAQMKTQNANLMQHVAQLSNHIVQMNQQVQRLTGTLDAVSQQVQYLASVQHTQASKEAQAQLAKVAKVHEKKVKEIKRWSATPMYNVEAMIPHRAWLTTLNGDTLTVQAGDRLAGYGRVVQVDVQRGIVLTTSGKIIRYSAAQS
ncbi:MAG: hypothetical protein DHS20C10_09560 [marine bacterium B5-7]|nr:MAG: hypothetical protein DHS20C10_09560 [marine bacterium B5-7]